MNPAKRHPANTNLHLHYHNEYRSLPLLGSSAPFVEEYLEALYRTLQRANQQYPRLLGLRVDLMPPKEVMSRMSDETQCALISRFIASLKSQIDADRNRARRSSPRAPDCKLHYVWCREFDSMNHHRYPHFHFLLLFNKDAYFLPGRLGNGGDNLANRISKAWYSALGLAWDPAVPLIHLPRNCCYHVKSQSDAHGVKALFQRASYLCKADTKRYGNHLHGFGTSRG